MVVGTCGPHQGYVYFPFLHFLDPQKAPFLPHNLVGPVARFTFHTLTIPLIYSTIAIAVTVETVGNYWFVFVGTFVLIGVSYLVATSLACLLRMDKTTNVHDYRALIQAVAYPNIVALPILIFPSLCEYPVVYEGYIANNNHDDTIDAATLQRQCIAQSNTMIFCSFFSWSLLFWSVGHRQLMMAAAHDRHREPTRIVPTVEETTTKEMNGRTIEEETIGNETEKGRVAAVNWVGERDHDIEKTDENEEPGSAQPGSTTLSHQERPDGAMEPSSVEQEERGPREEPTVGWLSSLWHALKQTMASPGFMAMAAAFITACIPPLQKALFEAGGSLRFLGSAMETLGNASSPLSTMVVAASLVPPPPGQGEEERSDEEEFHVVDENPGMTDPNFGPYQRPRRRRVSRFQTLRRSMRRVSSEGMQTTTWTSHERLRWHLWYCTSRLVLTPAVIVGLILALDCSGGELLGRVTNLAKLVVIVNASLPGALIVIVLLKCDDRMTETAAVVAKVYMSSYFLSIFTITAWTALGLWITLPDEDGRTICGR